MVMERGAALPDRCVRSNEPAQRRLERKLIWHRPLWILLFPLCLFPLRAPIIFVIVMYFVRKQATIYIALSDRWLAKRRRGMLIGWGLVFLALGTFIVGGAMVPDDMVIPIMVVASAVGLVGIVFGRMSGRIVYARRITDTHIWVDGVCREFLDELPTWQGG